MKLEFTIAFFLSDKDMKFTKKEFKEHLEKDGISCSNVQTDIDNKVHVALFYPPNTSNLTQLSDDVLFSIRKLRATKYGE